MNEWFNNKRTPATVRHWEIADAKNIDLTKAETQSTSPLYKIMRRVQVPNLMKMTWPDAVLSRACAEDPDEILGIVHGLEDAAAHFRALWSNLACEVEEREWNRMMAL